MLFFSLFKKFDLAVAKILVNKGREATKAILKYRDSRIRRYK
jgi:hypothetical protein